MKLNHKWGHYLIKKTYKTSIFSFSFHEPTFLSLSTFHYVNHPTFLLYVCTCCTFVSMLHLCDFVNIQCQAIQISWKQCQYSSLEYCQSWLLLSPLLSLCLVLSVYTSKTVLKIYILYTVGRRVIFVLVLMTQNVCLDV